jgi:hypothetical protein
MLAFFSWLETNSWQAKANHRWTDEPKILRDVNRVNYDARRYVLFLAASGRMTLDWEWLLAMLHPSRVYERLGTPLGDGDLIKHARALGYRTPEAALMWSVGRLCLHTGATHYSALKEEQVLAARDIIRAFGTHPDVCLFYGSTERYQSCAYRYLSSLYTLQVVFYHLGQVKKEPCRSSPRPAPPRLPTPPRMQAVHIPLEKACQQAGLVSATGKPLITAHRFRHTVGTQLAGRSARLHTIMRVLGHESPSMSIVYATISDKEVLKDYQMVLAPGAVLAGPSTEAIRGGILSQHAVEWLKTNFFKTELELGRCLRLPEEGPCECDLFSSSQDCPVSWLRHENSKAEREARARIPATSLLISQERGSRLAHREA